MYTFIRLDKRISKQVHTPIGIIRQMFRNKSYSIRTGLVIKASTVQITLGGIHVFPTDFSDVGYTDRK